jgi:hypothetical protein
MKIFAFIVTYLLSTPFWTIQVMAKAKFSVNGVVFEQKGLNRERVQDKRVVLDNVFIKSTDNNGEFVFKMVSEGIHNLKVDVLNEYRVIEPEKNEIEFKVTDSDMKDFFFVIKKKYNRNQGKS